MSERNTVVPDAMLSKEFLSQFKTEADVSKFLSMQLPIYTHVCGDFRAQFLPILSSFPG